MNICDETQMYLSAALDGEADPDELLAAMDHLLECATCQRFYRQARRLDGIVTAAPDAFVAPAPQKRHGIDWHWLLQPGVRWAAAASAAVLIAVGIWQAGPPWSGPDQTAALDTADLVVITLEEDKGHLTDERFIEMAVALLRADQRYRHKMTEILGQVEERASLRRNEAELASTRHTTPEGSDEMREPFWSEAAYAEGASREIL